jgi:hypothetical protein
MNLICSESDLYAILLFGSPLFVFSKLLNITEGTAYKITVNCTNAIKLKSIGKYLLKSRCNLAISALRCGASTE